MKLSLLDHAKIVLASALACAGTMSFHRSARLRGADLGSVLCIDGMVLSILLTAFTYAFVRPGPRRVALIEALVLSAALAFLIHLVWEGSKIIPQHLRGGGVGNLDGNDWHAIVIALGVALFAGPLVGRLGRRALVLLARRRSAG